MNEVLQKIMTFINENTLLLIGICVFLILVLIGYLIDNSVKSKRIRNDIKNKDQVPQNIKEEIIKEAEVKGQVKQSEEVKENISVGNINNNQNVVSTSENESQNINIANKSEQNTNIELDSKNDEVTVNTEIQNDALDSALSLDNSNMNSSFNVEDDNNSLDSSLNLDNSLKVEDTNLDNLTGDNASFDTNLNLTDKQADTLDFGLDSGIISNDTTPTVDPDAFIMGSVLNNENEYKNDKKLSEILFENNSLNIEETNNSNEAPLNIEINNEQQDELEQIMQKLSSLKNDTEEDNYTNIF